MNLTLFKQFKQFYKQYPLAAVGLSLIGLNMLFGRVENTLVFQVGLLLFVIGLWWLVHQKRLTPFLNQMQGWFNYKTYQWAYLAFVVLWIVAYLCMFFNLRFPAFDTVVFATQMAALVVEGQYYSHTDQIHGLAGHFEPAMFLFLPLFQLYNSVVWLLAVKLLSFLFAPVLLYKIGKAALPKGSFWVYVCPMLWMIHNYAANTLSNFQPSTLSISLILLAFYWLQKERYVLAWFPLVLALLLKEHMGLVWVSAGAYLWLFKDKRFLGASLAVIGIVYGLVVVGYVMPYFGDGGYYHTNKLDPLALPGAKIQLLVLAYLSVACLPLLQPKTTWLVLPLFAITLLTGVEFMVSFDVHHLDIAFPVLFVASILGLQAVQQPSHWWHKLPTKHRQWLLVGVILLGLFNNFYLPPTRNIRDNSDAFKRYELFFEADSLRKQLNPAYLVRTTQFIVVYFSYMPNITKYLKVFYDLKELENCNSCDPEYIVFPTTADMDPDLTLTEHQALEQSIHEQVNKGNLQLKIEGKHLKVYQSTKNSTSSQ